MKSPVRASLEANPKAAHLLTVPQAAEYAPAFGERYFRRLIADRKMPFFKIGGRVFISRDDIDQLVAQSRIEAIR